MILVRVDADPQIGTGHMMRCLALASFLSQEKQDVLFVTSTLEASQAITKAGYECILLPQDIRGSFNAELFQLSLIVERKSPRMMIVDSYAYDRDELKEIDSLVPVAFFDDMQLDNLEVDTIINGNITADVLAYDAKYGETAMNLLVGTKYCVLRKEFECVQGHKDFSKLQNILISTGGADPFDASLVITKELLSYTFLDKVHINVMVGSMNPNYTKLKDLAKQNQRLNVLRGITEVSKIMEKADLAIAAGGTTLNELCVCGVPTICYALADNQLNCIDIFAKEKAAISVGHINSEEFISSLYSATRNLAGNQDLRRALSTEARKLYDGKGAYRIAKDIIER